MIAVIEKNGLNADNVITIISAENTETLRSQIERFFSSPLSSTVWAKLYLDGDTVDLGGYQIVLFETNSIITVTAKTHTSTVNRVMRDYLNLKPL